MSCTIEALTPNAQHKSSYGLNCTFTETDPDTGVVSEVTPSSVDWTLTDSNGNTIDSDSESPASTVFIVLKGDDLDTAVDLERIITIDWVYDSVIFGLATPGTKQKRIIIDCYKPIVA